MSRWPIRRRLQPAHFRPIDFACSPVQFTALVLFVNHVEANSFLLSLWSGILGDWLKTGLYSSKSLVPLFYKVILIVIHLTTRQIWSRVVRGSLASFVVCDAFADQRSWICGANIWLHAEIKLIIHNKFLYALITWSFSIDLNSCQIATCSNWYMFTITVILYLFMKSKILLLLKIFTPAVVKALAISTFLLCIIFTFVRQLLSRL